MIAYLLANWKQLGGVAVAFGVLGYALHRPPQSAVKMKIDDTATQVGKSATDVHKQEAAVHTVRRKFACPTVPGAPSALSEETVTDRGPVATDVKKNAQHANAQEHKLDLTITPAPRPGWAVGVGLEGLPADRVLRLSLRRRLFGPFWAEVAVQPAARALGAGLAVEW